MNVYYIYGLIGETLICRAGELASQRLISLTLARRRHFILRTSTTGTRHRRQGATVPFTTSIIIIATFSSSSSSSCRWVTVTSAAIPA